ncbi:endonuclease MutS2 [Clostridium sp. 19966]|uniref:endonuclease MutS2 n=1 Tax=Clostridium sp. 19966 TaxID=2768166 RepID=UPI0028DFBE13|nr:endonuclease MutS2 [Clostridium sp. 19966]MDT8716520.1 endonuclease MutS2 [Clostridium sp. 19966]
MDEKALRVLELGKIKEKIKYYAQTAAAKELIDNLKPYENIYDMRERLQETKEALDIYIKKGAAPFEGVYDVRDGLSRAEKGASLGCSEIYRIANILSATRRLKEYVIHKDEEEPYEALENICEGIVPFKKLEDEILSAIIAEDEISDRASETLYSVRKELKNKNSSVKDKVNELIRKYSKYLQDNLYTVRGDRYVIPVKSEHRGSVPGLVHDQSSTGATLFIEPMNLVELNNDIRELMLKEKAEIERILSNFSKKIASNIKVIKNNADILWEMDFIFCKAKYAYHINATCPIVSEDGSFYIIKGRHPLIEESKVVPITVSLGKEYTSLVITGPNTGGKTVTLKTIGLIHLMAMSGILIPAGENSVVSFYEKIFADIGDEQSIEQSLSTFSSHMKNIVNIMDKADKNTLVLFDELGAGTDPVEGAALAVAILENLRSRSTRIIATTHYSELKGYALKTQHVENASVEFDVETLRPTYKLLVGIPGKSNAFEISRRLGLEDYIIEEARKNISSNALVFEDLIMNLQEKSIEAEKNAHETSVLKAETEKIKLKYQEKLYNLEKHRENIMQNAQREAKSVLRDAKEEADLVMKNVRELEKMGYDGDIRNKLENERKRLKDKLEGISSKDNSTKTDEGEHIKNVKVGEEVMLSSLNQKVTILTLPDNKGDLQVQAGIMKVSVNIKDLRASGKVKTNTKVPNSKRELKLNLRSVPMSIDLRGLDAEDAIYNVDKYLDDAYMAGLTEVTIIHGKGTGVLRKAVNDLLKSHPHAKSYRLGAFNEGGSGATVVELK